jgi:hypothetical protein
MFDLQSGGPDRRSCEHLNFQICRRLTGGLLPDLTKIIHISALRT